MAPIEQSLLIRISTALRWYVLCLTSLDDLHFALAAFDQEALDAARTGDDRAEKLLGSVGCLIAEYTDGHRTKESVYREIAGLVYATPVYVRSWTFMSMSTASTYTGTSNF